MKRRATAAAPKSKSLINAELSDWVSKSTIDESDGGKARSGGMKRRRDSDSDAFGKPARRRIHNDKPRSQLKDSSRRFGDKSARRNPSSSTSIMRNNGSSRESSESRNAMDIKKNNIQNSAKEKMILTDLISEEGDVDDDGDDDFVNTNVSSLLASGIEENVLATSSSYLSETRYVKSRL